jgi:hypothetical protein
LPESLRACCYSHPFFFAACTRERVTAEEASGTVTLEDARAIAKEAYIHGNPVVDKYRNQYDYFVNEQSPEYGASWNKIFSMARIFTPEDNALQSPGSATSYSFVGMDLRSEPLVLSVPTIEKGRYFSLQFIDNYTHNFAYAGSRTNTEEDK